MEIFGLIPAAPLAWGGLTIVLGLIGYLLNKFMTDAAVIGIKVFVYKPIFAIFRAFTVFLNGLTGGWWNVVGEPYFVLFLTAVLQSCIDAAIDGLNSDAGPQVVYKSKPYAIKMHKMYTV